MRMKMGTTMAWPTPVLLTEALTAKHNAAAHIAARNRSKKKMKNLPTSACNPNTTMPKHQCLLVSQQICRAYRPETSLIR